MKAPAFQFYVKDWRNNLKLRASSEAARGAWMDVLCLMHDSEEYGVLRMPLKAIARAAGVKLASLRELAKNRVIKGADSNVSAFVHTPRHAGKKLPQITLIPASEGPCWYCSRFVRDEWVRQRRGGETRFTADNQPGGKVTPVGVRPNGTPNGANGARQGDGPAVAVASAVNSINQHQVLVAGELDRAVDNPRIDPGTSKPPPDPWRRDPNAAMRKLQEFGLTNWSGGKSLPECVRRIEQEIAKRQRDQRQPRSQPPSFE